MGLEGRCAVADDVAVHRRAAGGAVADELGFHRDLALGGGAGVVLGVGGLLDDGEEAVFQAGEFGGGGVTWEDGRQLGLAGTWMRDSSSMAWLMANAGETRPKAPKLWPPGPRKVAR